MVVDLFNQVSSLKRFVNSNSYGEDVYKKAIDIYVNKREYFAGEIKGLIEYKKDVTYVYTQVEGIKLNDLIDNLKVKAIKSIKDKDGFILYYKILCS